MGRQTVNTTGVPRDVCHIHGCTIIATAHCTMCKQPYCPKHAGTGYNSVVCYDCNPDSDIDGSTREYICPTCGHGPDFCHCTEDIFSGEG